MTTTKKTTPKPKKSTKTAPSTKPAPTASKRAPAKTKTVAPKTIVGAAPSHEEIARLAYSLFEARGFEHGHDVDDWRTAEAELARGI